MADTNISWTQKVWNPTIGCSRVSSGCGDGKHGPGGGCYAESFARRLEGMGQERYRGLTVLGKQGVRWTGEVRQVPEVLGHPLRWRKPRRIFVNSMSDLFHEKVPFEYIAAVFGVMAACPRHTFQVLTKRPARALEWFNEVQYHYGESRNTPAEGCRWEAMQRIEHRRPDGSALPGPTRALYGYDTRWPLPNVHLGVSTEDQATADERIPILLKCPAAVRWASMEPLLGPIDARRYLWPSHWSWPARYSSPEIALLAGAVAERKPQALVSAHANFIRWIVVGGESGTGHREMEPAWVDDLVQQAKDTGTPIFVKQDSGPKPGKQGRLSYATWTRKEFPEASRG